MIESVAEKVIRGMMNYFAVDIFTTDSIVDRYTDRIMVSIEKIPQKFIQLDEYLRILDEIAKVPKKQFLKDKVIIGFIHYSSFDPAFS